MKCIRYSNTVNKPSGHGVLSVVLFGDFPDRASEITVRPDRGSGPPTILHDDLQAIMEYGVIFLTPWVPSSGKTTPAR